MKRIRFHAKMILLIFSVYFQKYSKKKLKVIKQEGCLALF